MTGGAGKHGGRATAGDSLTELVRGIEAARQRFTSIVASLRGEEASTAIGEGRWSPVEYLEHLVRAEEATLWRMFKAVEDRRAGKDVLTSFTPDASIEEVVERTWEPRETSPPLAVPQLRGSTSFWLVRMQGNAALVAAFARLVDDEELDSVAYPHPISGPLTMRQGLAFIRYHMERHSAHLIDAGIGGRGPAPAAR